jgi:hypothetical protein
VSCFIQIQDLVTGKFSVEELYQYPEVALRTFFKGN